MYGSGRLHLELLWPEWRPRSRSDGVALLLQHAFRHFTLSDDWTRWCFCSSAIGYWWIVIDYVLATTKTAVIRHLYEVQASIRNLHPLLRMAACVDALGSTSDSVWKTLRCISLSCSTSLHVCTCIYAYANVCISSGGFRPWSHFGFRFCPLQRRSKS